MTAKDSHTHGLPSHKTMLGVNSLRALFWRYHFWLITVLASSVILACAWFVDNNNNEAHLQKVRADVQNQLSTIRARLEGTLNSNIQAVNGLVSAISIEPNMSQKRFAMFAKPLIERDNQLRNIGGAPGMVISLMYPIEGNEKAIGLNYLENVKQRQGAIMARDTGQLVLAGPVKLLQGGQGFIGRIPVYSENIETGERRFWGLISAVIDADELYSVSGLFDDDLSLDLAIFGHDKRFSNGTTFYGNDGIFSKYPVLAFIELPFGNWQLAAIPKNGWPSVADNVWQFRLIITLISLLILAPLLILTWLGTHHREQQLRLKALFELSPLGIALNDFKTGKYINVNKRLAEDTGYTLNELESLSYWDLTPKKYKKEEAKQLESLINTGAYGPYEKEYINKQGIAYPVLLNGILIKDSQGRKLIWSYIQNISLQKQAENKLQENNKQLELIINSTQVGIWDWQIQTAVLTVNERWASIIGYTIAELGDISIETWLTHAHADDLEDSGNKLQAHWDNETEYYTFEGRMNHKAGHDIWILDTGKVIEWDEYGKPKRMVGTHLDITEKKLAEQNLAKTNESLESQIRLVKTIASAQRDFIKNSDYNAAFKNLIKNINLLTDSELSFIGNVYYENGKAAIKVIAFNGIDENSIDAELKIKFERDGVTFSRSDNLFVESANSQVPLFLNNAELHVESSLIPDNHPKLKNYIAIPIIQKGTCLGMIGLANREMGFDINLVNWLSPLTNTVGQLIERVETIREKEKSELALIDAKNEAESAGKAKTEFLATMSHEIRTPMNGVLGMLTLLQKSKLTPEQIKKVDIAKISAESLLSIINDVLDFTKIESGKLELESVSFNIRNLVDEVCQSMALRIQEKNIELVIDSSGLTQDHITSDPVRIRQVLTNLIGNAGKFTSQGEIIVKSQLLEKDNTTVLQCEIIDSGIGIPEQHIKKLFISFSQVDASTTRKFGGTGLGLSICKRICELMEGTISVASKENIGSCFSFQIPIEKPKIDQPSAIPSNISKLNILIVHSNEKSVQAIINQLQQWGNTPHFCHGGAKAQHIIAQQEFDLIFIDNTLNDMTGIELGTYIHTNHPVSNARLVLMTTVNHTPYDEDMRKAGFNIHFSKPVTAQDLFLCLDFSVAQTPINNAQATQANTLLSLPENARILLVEDIPFNQEVAIMLLAEMGVTADVANNGEEGVEKVKTALKQNKAYDAILMDCQMPVMDGYDATRAIRQLEETSNHKVHIIAMTANAMSSDQEKCLAAGMDDYLTKPIDEDRLLKTLLKWLTVQ
jgi:PAS domain S-box-containing protein